MCRYVGTGTGEPSETRPGAECVTIASLNPLSGGLGAVGFALESAARLAVADVNQAGLPEGKKLCMVACDSRTDPATVEATLESVLAEYGVVAVNGAAESGSSLEAARILGPRNIPQVSCCSTSPALSEDPDVYRTVPSDALQGVVLANVARTLSSPASTMSVIYVNDAYGQALARVFADAFARLGGVVLESVPYDPGAPSYFDVVERALAGRPDDVLLVAFPADGAEVLRSWRLSGLAPSTGWLATDGLRDDKFVLAAAGPAEGVVGTAPRLQGAHYTSFDARYRRAFGGEAPGIFTSNQYDAVVLIALAMARARSFQAQAVKAAVPLVASAPGTLVSADDLSGAMRLAIAEDIDYSGASGELEMDANGDVVTDYRVWRVANGTLSDTADCWTCGTTTSTSAVVCSKVLCR